ncbi:MAG: TlpA family protein disulfide reductase [Proteobacteria bacterium]|nr:TlpA family protein disulfide reductase [Pseudomonadota bacterium]
MTTPADKTPGHQARPRLVVIVAGTLAGIAVGLAGVYGITAMRGNAADPACQGTIDVARRIAPLVHGEIAALNVATQPRQLPRLAFQDAGATPKTLADWGGRTILLNLWATWCVPCRKEMPALDALQQQLGGPNFEVVAINIDTRDPQKPMQWLREIGINGLKYYSDASAKVFQELKVAGKAVGLPTTVLIDGNGCDIAYLAGPAEWASKDAVALVKAAIK